MVLKFLIGLLMLLGFLFYLYIQVDKVRSLFRYDEYVEIFDAETLPNIQEQALAELMDEGV